MSKHGSMSMILLAMLLGGQGCSLHGKQSAMQNGRSPWDSFKSAKASYENPEEVEEESIPRKVTDTVTLKLRYARWMEETGNLPEAKNHYMEVLKANSKNVEALLGKARVELASGEVDAAEQGFQRVLKIDASFAEAHSGLGKCQAEKKQWAEAAVSMAKASAGLPEDKGIRHQLAIALVHTGDVQAAQLHFSQSVGAAAGHYNTALILKDEGRVQEAEEQLEMALRRDPSLKDAERWLSELRNSHHAQTPAGNSRPGEIQPQIAQASFRDFGAIGTAVIEPAVYVPEVATSPSPPPTGHSPVMGVTQK